MKNSWIIEVQFPTKSPMWVGNIYASSRPEAKKAARLFLTKHYTTDPKIIRIAQGHISIEFHGEPTQFDED